MTSKRKFFVATVAVLLAVSLFIISRNGLTNTSADSLDFVTGLAWESGSSATATWNIVSEANYYEIEVYVFSVETSKEA